MSFNYQDILTHVIREAIRSGRGHELGQDALNLAKGYFKQPRWYNWKANNVMRNPIYRYPTAGLSSTFQSSRLGGRAGFRKGRRRRFKKKNYVPRGVKSYVKSVVKHNRINDATNTWRKLTSGQVSCNVNECAYTYYNLLTSTDIEEAIDAAKSPQVSSNIVAGITTDFADTTADLGARSVDIVNARRVVNIRNNAQAPFRLEAYWLWCIRRCSSTQTPVALLENGFEDKGQTSGEMVNPRFNVCDSSHLKRFFRIKKKREFLMNGGDEIKLQLVRNKPFKYDPQMLNDYSSFSRIPGVTQALLVRIIGCVSHDDTTTQNVGTTDATYDYISTQHTKFSVDPSQGFKYLISEGAYDTQAAGAVLNSADVEEVKETL